MRSLVATTLILALTACAAAEDATGPAATESNVEAVSLQRATVNRTTTQEITGGVLGAGYGDCTTEAIEISGTVTTTTMSVSNGNNTQFRFQQRYNLSGVGLTSGGSYKLISVENQVGLNLGADEQTNFTRVVRFRLIGQGGLPSLHSDVLFHYTVNANGELVVSRFEGSTTCR